MSDQEYRQVKDYHQRLLDVAATARWIKTANTYEARLSLSDRLLIRLGDRLISLGEGIKNRKRGYALTEECA